MKVLPINNINFKNSVKETEKKKKYSALNTEVNGDEKRKNKNTVSYIALTTALTFGAVMLYRTRSNRIKNITGPSNYGKRTFDFGNTEIEFKNFENDNTVKSLDELSGLAPLKKFCDEYMILSKHPETVDEHNIELFSSLLFWGLPGTGKTTGAKGFAKKIGANYTHIDKEFFDSMLVSEGPRRLSNIIQQIYEYATYNNDRPLVVFMDEIDGTISIDRSNIARHSDDLVNTLKQGLTYLQDRCHNIIFIGATNKDPNGIKSDNVSIRLNPAILDRFKYQVEFKLPQIDEIGATWNQLAKTKSGINKFTEEESHKIAEIFHKLGTSFRGIESTADKMNRCDAVEFCNTGAYHSKINLIKAMRKDEKIGYDPVKKKNLPKETIDKYIKELEEFFQLA